MTDFLDAMFANALLTIPFAILVAIVARWLNRPAAVHVLWMIVLLKLVCPHFYDVRIPGLAAATAHFATPVNRATTDFEFPAASANSARPSAIKNDPPSSTGMDRFKLFGNDSRELSEIAPLHISHSRVRPEPKTEQALVEASSSSTRGVVIFVWGLGTATFFLLLGYRARRFHQFVERAPYADDSIQSVARSIVARYGLRASPKIRVASGDFPPLLWVLPGSASIVLPQKLISELGPNATQNLLAHELAHFARGDQWVRLLESVVLGICWWHPLAWWARRQLQHAEELCCDAWVMWAYPKSKTEYARTLLATLDYLSGARAVLPPLASGLGRANLIRRRFEMILHSKSPRKLSAIGMTATAIVALAILPWSTSVFAQPQNTTVAAESDFDSEEEDSSSDLERIERRVEQRKQRAQKRQTKQQTEKDGKPSQSTDLDVYIEHVIDSADVHRLIQAAVRRAVKEAHVGLKHAKSHLAEEVQVEVARSLNKLSNSDWLHSMTDSLDALDSISEEEIEAITEHIETAMEHIGVAVEKSAEAFAKVMDAELEAMEAQSEVAEKHGQKSPSDLLLEWLKTVESFGLSNEELKAVVAAVGEATENLEGEVEIHIATKDNETVLESAKPTGTGKTRRVPSKLRQNKLKNRREQVDTILRQIKSLVKQLEEKVEADSDATSTLR